MDKEIEYYKGVCIRIKEKNWVKRHKDIKAVYR